MTPEQTLAKNVKALRRQTGLSQEQLAKRSKLSVRYTSRLENTNPNVTIDVVGRLARGLDCSVSRFLSDEKPSPSTAKMVQTIDQIIRLLQGLRRRLGQ